MEPLPEAVKQFVAAAQLAARIRAHAEPGRLQRRVRLKTDPQGYARAALARLELDLAVA